MRTGYQDFVLGLVSWVEHMLQSAPEFSSVHRVEFSSQRTQDWRITLRAQSDAQDISEIRVDGNWPHNKE